MTELAPQLLRPGHNRLRVLCFIPRLKRRGTERQCVELLGYLASTGQYDLLLVLTSESIDYAEFFELGVPHVVIPRYRSGKDPRLVAAFWTVCAEFQPTSIIAWSNMTAVVAIPYALATRTPLINYQIQTAPALRDGPQFLNRIAWCFSDAVLANSAAGLSAFAVPPYEGAVVHNGFDFARLNSLESPDAVRHRLGIEADLLVGMVGTFGPQKDYHTFIEAMNVIGREREDVAFIGVGPGDREPYQKLIDPSLKNRLKLLGPQEDVEALMSACDVGVLASYTEGIPNVLLEFMACAKPVVTTDGGGTRELVLDQDTGFLIRVGDSAHLSNRVKQLLDQPNLRKRMGLSGRARVLKHFSIRTLGERFSELLSVHSLRNRGSGAN
jgi:glycosyltransferase involved in cell wall biosynthesis